ncbi:hypothetical protein [Streptomyces sp. URMC 124]|uniref:hypothetical protein n=1 Tax=Streptomyces sp. URMC 124 TaxID=3423405 RepID=UPI003F1D2B30
MARSPLTPAEYWDLYKPYRGTGEQPAPPADRFEWTQFPDHGPGPEILGTPRTALERVFSHAEPGPGAHGAQQMGGKWLEGRERELTVLRWQYEPGAWADLLKRSGFSYVDARIVPPPGDEALGTLLVRAGVA